MDYKALIAGGKSVREYKTTPIDKKAMNEIKNYAKASRKLISDIAVAVEIMENSQVFNKLDGVAGYKGHMIDAPCYIIIFSEVKDRYIENSGCIGEDIILKANELGVDACWITFKDSNEIKVKLEISTNKEVTAIIALGYNASTDKKVVNPTKTGQNYSKSNLDVVSSNTSYRLGVEEVVYIKEWGKNATIEQLEERAVLDAFHYARMAPSTLNRQPWRFILDDGIVVLAVRKDEHTNTYEEQIDAGIVMLYFEAIVDTTLFDLNWKFEQPAKDYKIADDYEIVAYCNI